MKIKTLHLLQGRSSKTLALFILTCCLFLSCQSAEQPQEEAVAVTEQPVAVADTTKTRPAPDFYIIPPGMERKRVWVCDDGVSDVFHVNNTCTVLQSCKGTFRNVSFQRAIEEYGRYNCEVCSKELADIFDENKVR